MNQLVINNFSVKRGSFALSPISLTIQMGEIFAILGRTGSGKTVLLEAISGMFPGDTGSILLDGTDIRDIPPSQRKLGLVYQDYGLFPHMKVKENISYGLKMHGYSKKEQDSRAQELMEMLSISHIGDQYPGTLSGGESQRTALARALALAPQVLLLDEPFSALDPAVPVSGAAPDSPAFWLHHHLRHPRFSGSPDSCRPGSHPSGWEAADSHRHLPADGRAFFRRGGAVSGKKSNHNCAWAQTGKEDCPMTYMNDALSFYSELRLRFMKLLTEEGILGEQVVINTKSLTPEEAIGITKRKDFPIITGKDVMVQAECMGSLGQAFTDAPSAYRGTLEEICSLDLADDPYSRGLFIAALNAVMKHSGRADCTVHCRNEGPESCAMDVVRYISEHYGRPAIALIGYQPAMLEQLAKEYDVRAADLSLANIGQKRFGVLIEDGRIPETSQSLCRKADLVLCTGSTVCNGSIVDFLPFKEKILFYGTTLAGAAPLMGLPRLCFADRYQEPQ